MTQAIAVMPMLHEPAGDGNSATRRFRDRPVLDWTLRRLSAAKSIGTRVILCWDDQVEAVQDITRPYGADVATAGARGAVPTMDAVTAARRWADGWRSGPLQTCEFDRGFHAPWLVEIAKSRSADALVLIDPAAGLVDAGLIDGLVAHAQAHATRPLIFSQAAPGLSGVFIRLTLLEQLAGIKVHPGKFIQYQPSQPTRDPISELNCAPVPTPIARTVHRFTLDSEYQIDKLAAATVHLNGELIGTDALGILKALTTAENAKNPSPRPSPLSTGAREQIAATFPRETVLELTTRRATKPIFAPATHLRIDRSELTIDAAKQIFTQLARRDDARLVLGGVGDPLMAENVFEIIDAAAAAGIRAIHVRTDLLGVTAERIAKLAAGPIDLISIQIPAITAKTYLAVMGVDGLNQVIENIKLLIHERAARGSGTPILVPVFVKCRQNLAEMETWYDKWLGALGSAVIQGPSDYAGQIPDHAAADMSPPARRACGRISSRVHILSDGQVTACEQDPLGRHAVGGVASESLQSLWSLSLAQLRTDHREGNWDKHPLCARCREWHRP